MTRRDVIVALVAGALALGGWAWAQQKKPASSGPQTEATDPQPKGFPGSLPAGGPFAVSQVGQSVFLLDSSSGKTWELTHSAGGQAVWLPGKRIDSEKEAEEWRQHNRQQLEEGLYERKRLDKEDAAPLPKRPRQ